MAALSKSIHKHMPVDIHSLYYSFSEYRLTLYMLPSYMYLQHI